MVLRYQNGSPWSAASHLGADSVAELPETISNRTTGGSNCGPARSALVRSGPMSTASDQHNRDHIWARPMDRYTR